MATEKWNNWVAKETTIFEWKKRVRKGGLGSENGNGIKKNHVRRRNNYGPALK